MINQGDRLVGLILLGAVVTGLMALFGAVLVFLDDPLTGTAAPFLVAAALAFGLSANAVLRDA